MATSVEDFKISSLAAGFTLGFGLLTTWTAMQQTMQLTNPWKSVYIYMVWGEIVVNFILAVVAWLFLDGQISISISLYFWILVLWVFEIQLLMQIIINRISVVVENRRTAFKVKWGVALLITCVNIAVFCIWIPAHLEPPVSQLYVTINKYWDRTSKIIILIVDASLNYYFLRTVRVRLVKYHGLKKYSPLVRFNFRLMAVSICMDIMIIGLMSLPNPIVYVQFHPVAYIVKLNIEMSMAALITKIALGGERTDFQSANTSNNTFNHAPLSFHERSRGACNAPGQTHHLRTFSNQVTGGGGVGAEEVKGIRLQKDVVVKSWGTEQGDEEAVREEGSDEVPLRPAEVRLAGRGSWRGDADSAGESV